MHTLVEYERLVEFALRVGLVDYVALQPLRERAFGSEFGFDVFAVDDYDLEVACKTASLTSIGEHHGEYREHEVFVFRAFYALHGHELRYGFEFAVDALAALVQEYGGICGYGVDAEDAECYVEFRCVGVVGVSHNRVAWPLCLSVACTPLPCATVS